MFSSFQQLAVKGVCAAVPAQVVTLDQLIAESDKNTAFRLRRVAALAGLRKRHLAPADMFSGDLALAAGRELLSRLNWDPESVNMLFFVTQTPDFLSPPTGYLIAKALGLTSDCVVSDITAGCLGMLQGIWMACGHLSAEYPRALILSGDVSSKVVPAEDVGNSVLMGDGIGAFAMEFVPEQKQQISFTLSNFPDTESSLVNYDSGYRPVPGKPDGMVMAGNKITEFCLNNVPRCLEMHMQHLGKRLSDMDVVFLHQPNKAILDTLMRRLDVQREKLPMIFDEYANCSSASLPLSVCRHAGTPGYTGIKQALFAAFGSGLAVVTMFAELDMANCFPVVALEKGELYHP